MNESGSVQPDASNCGGTSGWLEAASMAQDVEVPVCSHGMQELHVTALSRGSGTPDSWRCTPSR